MVFGIINFMFLLCLSRDLEDVRGWKSASRCRFFMIILSMPLFFCFPFCADCGTTLRCIKASASPINQLLFLSSEPKAFVASSANQIKIYDLDSFVRKNEFSPGDDARINSVKIVPHDDRLFVVLHTDIICILSNSLKLIRRFEPLKVRQKYLQKSNQKMERVNYIHEPADDVDDNDADVDKLIKSVTRDYQNGIVQSVSFAPNGSSFCVSFLDNSLMLCSTTMWDVRRVIKFPDFYIKQCDFITSSHDRHSPSWLLTLTSNDDLMLVSLRNLNSKMLIEMNNSTGFVLSANERVLLNIQLSGEILAYDLDDCVNSAVESDVDVIGEKVASDVKCTKHDNDDGWSAELDKVQMKVIMRQRSFFRPHRLLVTRYGAVDSKFRSTNESDNASNAV